MKKILLLLILMLTLCACGEKDFETVGDVYNPDGETTMGKMEVELPQDATVFTSLSDGSKLYFCEGYEILLETFRSGDLDGTLRAVTGYGKDALTVMETAKGGIKCVECAWTSADDEGDRVGRTVVLDDGAYHYCLTFQVIG